MKSIIFLLGAKYPSEKAYAITIGRTVQALSKNRQYQVEIWCQSSLEEEQFDCKTRKPARWSLANIVWRINEIKFTKWGFVSSNMLLANYFVRKSRQELFNSKVITREIYQALVLVMHKHKEVYLELHQITRNPFSKLVLKIIVSKLKGILVLQASQNDELVESGMNGSRIHIVPVAVPTEFFVDSTTKKSSKEIVYLGRSKSSGVDNNLNLIIEALEILGEKESRKFSVSMIGIFPDEFGQTWDLGFIKGGRKTDLNVKFFPNLKHEDIVGKLRGTAIGIVPYSYNTYHSQRFPIKILEYAASRNLIVASDVYQKNGILDETTALFFDATSSLSLVKALGRALNQDQKHIIDNAQRWARNYTYDMRASKLITIFANDK